MSGENKNIVKPIMRNRVLIVMCGFVIGVYFMFAVFPDIFNISFMPTGGWDWLSFIGIAFAATVAYYGVISTIDDNMVQARYEKQASVVPLLDVVTLPYKQITRGTKFFRVLSDDKNGTLINETYLKTADNQIPEKFNPTLSICVENIGLSAAIQVHVLLHEADRESYIRAEKLIKDKVRIDEDTYFNQAKTKSDPNFITYTGDKVYGEFEITDIFNLGANANNQINLVFDLSRLKRDYHFIMEFRFKDIYKNGYNQLLYLKKSKENRLQNKIEVSSITHLYEGYINKNIK